MAPRTASVAKSGLFPEHSTLPDIRQEAGCGVCLVLAIKFALPTWEPAVAQTEALRPAETKKTEENSMRKTLSSNLKKPKNSARGGWVPFIVALALALAWKPAA